MPQKTDTPNNDFVDLAWSFFVSLRLSVTLFIVIAAVLVAGTFIPQGEEAGKAQAVYSPGLYRFLDSIGGFDVYHTWWFTALLLLLCLNLVACTVNRFPMVWRRFVTRRPLVDEQVLGNARWTADLPYRNGESDEAALARVRAAAKAHLGTARVATAGAATTLWFDSGRISRLAFPAVHMSLLFILFGAIISSAAGEDGFVYVPEGSEVDYYNLRMPGGGTLRKDLPFSVRCDKFVYERFADGRPKEYRSTLTILERGKNVLTRDIWVNAPLEYGGMNFYQSSYQPDASRQVFTMEFEEKATGKKTTGAARRGEEIRAAGGAPALDAKYTIIEYNPDLGSFGPAIRVAREPASGDRGEFWLFQRFPGFDAKNREAPVTLKYTGGREAYATGLQVSRDPGTPFVFLGSAIMLVGLFAAFFMSHRQVWVRVTGGRVFVAASASRNPRGFEPKVRGFIETLKTGEGGRA
ncbi:MAG: cytochrome c biogenesis protein ResB [Deltaproteobacteria bacterium]|nr:cytochrome c biogenesis protein ResB [Deltaproteobacteria bacterium]